MESRPRLRAIEWLNASRSRAVRGQCCPGAAEKELQHHNISTELQRPAETKRLRPNSLPARAAVLSLHGHGSGTHGKPLSYPGWRRMLTRCSEFGPTKIH